MISNKLLSTFSVIIMTLAMTISILGVVAPVTTHAAPNRIKMCVQWATLPFPPYRRICVKYQYINLPIYEIPRIPIPDPGPYIDIPNIRDYLILPEIPMPKLPNLPRL
jgi:hypothetical protein